MFELHLERLPTTDLLDKNEPTCRAISRFPCMLGRHARCDERIDDLMVSRKHCRFILRDNWVWVEDLGSRNGTVLNGDRLTRALPLADGDVLRLGHVSFRVRVQDPAAASHESTLDESKSAEINRQAAQSPAACEAAVIS
jgi:pSer/pThr/pTyr-binding forkhead associated (FHA) protein